MLRERRPVPLVGGGRQRVEPRQRGIEIAADLMHEVDRRRDVHRLDIDLQQGTIVDPRFVFHLDRIVAETDDEIGGPQELALDLPAGPFDAAEREWMILVDHPLGHGRGGERQVVAFDDVAQQLRIGDAHRGCAEDRDRPLGRGDQFRRPGERGIGRGCELSRLRPRCQRFVGGGDRDVLRQIEMHRPLRLAQRQRDRLRHRLGHASRLKSERRLGDRLEQRMVVDPHLDAPTELVGVEIAGDRDQRRAIEEGSAHAGREVGRAGPQRRDAKSRRAGHAAGDVGGEAGGAFVRGEHEFDPARAHRLHQRQHVAARNAEAVGHPVRLQRCDDQIGVVHGGNEPRAPFLNRRRIA